MLERDGGCFGELLAQPHVGILRPAKRVDLVSGHEELAGERVCLALEIVVPCSVVGAS
jgi:hypothetical protein